MKLDAIIVTISVTKTKLNVTLSYIGPIFIQHCVFLSFNVKNLRRILLKCKYISSMFELVYLKIFISRNLPNLFYFVLVGGDTYPVVLRTLSRFCAQGLVLVGFKGLYGVLGLNLCWPDTRQEPYSLYYFNNQASSCW